MFLQGPPINVEWLNQRDWWADVDASAGLIECWPWQKSTASHGYGQTWDGVTVRLAHRVAWTLAVGPIPDGMTIDHLCRNRVCCNAAHMRLMTNVDNGRLNGNAIKTRCPQGHPYVDENMRRNARGHRWCLECSNERNAKRRAA